MSHTASFDSIENKDVSTHTGTAWMDITSTHTHPDSAFHSIDVFTAADQDAGYSNVSVLACSVD